MNFNFSGEPEYQLNTSLTEEMINLYGVLTKFLITEKINEDPNVFGDYSHMKSDSNKIYDIYMLPETSEDWEPADYSFAQFGIVNTENITLFAAYSSFTAMGADLDYITGNLIVLPNNKIMEVVSTSYEVPGINNLFVNSDVKSVVKLSCKPYDNKLIQELDNVDIDFENDPAEPYDTLDTYFQELIDDTQEQDIEAEVTPQVTVNVNNTKVQKPIVDRTEDDVWGQF
jgi:hypothetical protein